MCPAVLSRAAGALASLLCLSWHSASLRPGHLPPAVQNIGRELLRRRLRDDIIKRLLVVLRECNKGSFMRYDSFQKLLSHLAFPQREPELPGAHSRRAHWGWVFPSSLGATPPVSPHVKQHEVSFFLNHTFGSFYSEGCDSVAPPQISYLDFIILQKVSTALRRVESTKIKNK